ncbi:hypothetical protein ABMA27_010095 [Loxostege sticticalis]|uniref:Gustatory receptor n=1 Tax=Loxostege sticticalis TaxID=481309 RepID=A0ABR3H4J7_LOXSC
MQGASILTIIVTFAWILKNFVTETIMSIEFEYFHKSVNDAMVNSLLNLATDQSEVALRQWLLEVKSFSSIGSSTLHPRFSRTFQMINNDRNCCWKNKFINYSIILEAFELTKTAFQLMILYHCMETFIHAIVYEYYLLYYLRAGDANIFGTLATFGWILKNFVTETILSVEFEYFHKSVNEAMVNSLLNLANDQSEEQEKQMHMNVVRISRLSQKFELCNLFDMDAAMPRRLLSLIATYTIVLLQFVLL